ncbi:MAG: LysM peptidoglycan-binding domain-containing protein [Clostridiales Family XIII bacterium]|jgi:hypothetical protein|nr:LysM peptidoglycan-binding domain-containing protein [Clostridiales Family XIII bacterium]
MIRQKNRHRKSYRICSKIKFAIFLTSLAAVIFLAGGFVFADNAVTGMEIPSYAIVEIQSGDTLWQIASEHNNGQDIRRFIHEICRINDISAGDLRPGQMIRIPSVQMQ